MISSFPAESLWGRDNDEAMEGPVLGLDFGSSNSCIALWRPDKNKVKTIKNGIGTRITPSTISFCDGFDDFTVGVQRSSVPRAAEGSDENGNKGKHKLERIISGLKSLLIREEIGIVGKESTLGPTVRCTDANGESKDFSVAELAGMIMKNLKDSAENYLDRRPFKKYNVIDHKPVEYPSLSMQAPPHAIPDATAPGSAKPATAVAKSGVAKVSSNPSSKTPTIVKKHCLQRVVLGIPASFSEHQRAVLRSAANCAGFREVHFLVESTAAATAYGLLVAGSKTVLVVDVGGGTTDLTVMSVQEGGRFAIEASAGHSQLGGADFDRALLRHLLQRCCTNADAGGVQQEAIDKALSSIGDIEYGALQAALHKLLHMCRLAKEELSFSQEVSVSLPRDDVHLLLQHAGLAEQTSKKPHNLQHAHLQPTPTSNNNNNNNNNSYDSGSSSSSGGGVRKEGTTSTEAQCESRVDEDNVYALTVTRQEFESAIAPQMMLLQASVHSCLLQWQHRQQQKQLQLQHQRTDQLPQKLTAASSIAGAVEENENLQRQAHDEAGYVHVDTSPAITGADLTTTTTAATTTTSAVAGANAFDDILKHGTRTSTDKGTSKQETDSGSGHEVDEIVLVGGSSRVPAVSTALRRACGQLGWAAFAESGTKELCTAVNPEQVVAEGLAIRGAVISGICTQKLRNLLVLDCLPSSIGVLSWPTEEELEKDTVHVSENPGDASLRYFDAVLNRGDKIPARGVKRFALANPSQRFVSLDIYEEIEQVQLINGRAKGDAAIYGNGGVLRDTQALNYENSYSYYLIANTDVPVPPQASRSSIAAQGDNSFGNDGDSRDGDGDGDNLVDDEGSDEGNWATCYVDVFFVVDEQGTLSFDVKRVKPGTATGVEDSSGRSSDCGAAGDLSYRMVVILGAYTIALLALYIIVKIYLVEIDVAGGLHGGSSEVASSSGMGKTTESTVDEEL